MVTKSVKSCHSGAALLIGSVKHKSSPYHMKFSWEMDASSIAPAGAMLKSLTWSHCKLPMTSCLDYIHSNQTMTMKNINSTIGMKTASRSGVDGWSGYWMMTKNTIRLLMHTQGWKVCELPWYLSNCKLCLQWPYESLLLHMQWTWHIENFSDKWQLSKQPWSKHLSWWYLLLKMIPSLGESLEKWHIARNVDFYSAVLKGSGVLSYPERAGGWTVGRAGGRAGGRADKAR